MDDALEPATLRELLSTPSNVVLNDELRDGSDHAVALIAGSHLSERLRATLQDLMIPLGKRHAEALFEDPGPMATFSARIRLAHALGIIGPNTAGDLHRLRGVRNIFAHATRDVGFRTAPISRECNKFDAINRARIPKHFIMRGISRDVSLMSRNLFLFTAANIYNALGWWIEHRALERKYGEVRLPDLTANEQLAFMQGQTHHKKMLG